MARVERLRANSSTASIPGFQRSRGCHDTEDCQGRERDWDGRSKGKNLRMEHDIDLDPRIKVALLTTMLPADLQGSVVPVVGWEVHVRRGAGPDRLCGDQQGVNQQASSNGGGQKWRPRCGTRRSATMRVIGSRSGRNSSRLVAWESRVGSVEASVTTPESGRSQKGRGGEPGSRISNRTKKGSQKGRGSLTTGTSAKAEAKAKGRPLTESAGRAANVVIVLRIVRKVGPWRTSVV